MPIGASRQAVHSVYRFNSRCQELTNLFTIRFIIHIHSVFKYHISIPYSLSYYLFKDILNLCTHFIYSFTYSFHILIHVLISYLLLNYQNTGNKNRVSELTEAIGYSFLLFDLGPRLGDHHPPLVNNNHATLIG